MLHVYTVAQHIIKRSEAFAMAFDAGTPNFTVLPAGAVIATDGDIVHRVGPVPEMVVFPNPDVGIGLRAALMVRLAPDGGQPGNPATPGAVPGATQSW
jgi:succinylglutamate desuccinylase